MKRSLKISLSLFLIIALVIITGVIYFKIFKPVGQPETETSQPGRWIQPRQTKANIDKDEYEKLIGLGYLQGY
jgi:hypothetical protein